MYEGRVVSIQYHILVNRAFYKVAIILIYSFFTTYGK